jgi:prepilin-type N-terminal cleavage/methylation domain-containing protein/prepilin-type processing-associated H-X9-DG protein
MKRAFTLIELLVVIAIIAILAAILFPVFAQAKEAAKKTADLSNMKQHALSIPMYTADNDDVAPLWMYNGTFDVRPGFDDRSWGNLVFPYIKSDDLSKTPNSPFSIDSRKKNANFPNPQNAGALKRDQELYNLGWLTDYGYNYQHFTGFIYDPASPGGFKFAPVSMTSVGQPANTLIQVTGIFNRSSSGALLDGGQLPIDPPCRRDTAGNDLTANNGASAYYYGGWQPNTPNAWNVFGGVWPYYGGQGTSQGARASVGFADGHAKTMTIPQIAAGCNVLPSWGGRVFDRDKYIWDRDN